MHPACVDPMELMKACRLERARRGGPGGQRRNKVETAVILTHLPTGISAQAAERRSPAENQRLALFRLRLKLALEVREPFVSPLPVWTGRCRAGRIAVNDEHQDFPAMIAQALDAIEACGDSVSDAADRLGCTATQLVNLLRREPEALRRVNERRSRPLK
jgi:hypothetical protein